MKTILVLYCLLLKEIYAAVCSTLKPNGWIVFLSDDITNTKCYDTNESYTPPADYDVLDVSAYYQDGTTQKMESFKIVSQKGYLSTCLPTCQICIKNDKAKCLYCAGKSRGLHSDPPRNYELSDRKEVPCECRENFVDKGQPDCECTSADKPNYYRYTQAGYFKAYELCVKCPDTMKKCKEKPSTSPPEAIMTECFGVGRDPDTSCQSCAATYEEYSPPTADCKTVSVAPPPPPVVISCNAPCSQCVTGTSDKCTACKGKGRDTGSDCKSCAASYEEYSPPQADCLTSCQAPCSKCVTGTSDKCTACVGKGRDMGSDCKSCTSIYEEYSPRQSNCFLTCKPPCYKCVTDTSDQCLQCLHYLMSTNSGTKSCDCSSDSYMTYDKRNCYCNNKFNIFQVCDYTCKTCEFSSTNCLSCPLYSNRVYTQGSCPCVQYYYQIYGYKECFPCQWSCETCYNSDSCNTCPYYSNRVVYYPNNYGYFCQCKQGYAESLNSAQCELCSSTCLMCEGTVDTCLTCYNNQNRFWVNYKCACLQGYYDTMDSPVCGQCHNTCLQCDGGNSDSCLTCLESTFRVLNDRGECKCKLGYGYDESGSLQCQKCNGQCVECESYKKCIRCPTGVNRILDEAEITCVCDLGFYEDLDQKNCLPCHQSCLTCANPTTCLSCDKDLGKILNVQEKSCDCQPDYFENMDSKKCIACHYTCLTCVNALIDGCKSCPPSRQLQNQNAQNSQCLCDSVSKIDDGQSLMCINCHYTCSTCNGPDPDNCIICADKRVLYFGLCTCPVRMYDDQVNAKCLNCHDSCLTCFDSNEYSCVTCQEIDHRIQLSNSCKCEDGYFENDLRPLTCLLCEYRCATCVTDMSNCKSCPEGSLRALVQQAKNSTYKTCKCPSTAPNDVQGNPICQTCHFSCQNCYDKKVNQCTICDDASNRIINTDDSGTYCLCKLQYYEIKTPECAACSSYCLGCVDSASNCTSCNPEQFRVLEGNKCKCGVRYGTQYLSYYDNMQDPECVPCHYSCNTCYGTEYNQCLTCSDLDFRVPYSTQCQCKPKYIDNGEGICMRCNLSCETCAGQKNLCTSCPSGSLRTLNTKSQSCDCPEGYFDSGEILCEKCDITCATCTNQADTCLSCLVGSNRTYNQFNYKCECISGYYDTGNGICQICYYACLQCSGPTKNDCIQCPDFISTLRSLSYQECVCPDQYFDDSQNQLCQPCSSTCYTCQVNQNQCTQCVGGQNRVLSGQQCVCQLSYYDADNEVCQKCSTLCLECQISSTRCTVCDPLLKRTLDQGKCECNFGFYDDGTLTCKQCHFTCQTCITTSTNCTSCDNQNYRFLNLNTCPCQFGTIDQGVLLCFSCDTRCQTCTNTPAECLTCDSTKFRILSNKLCNCIDGYFENDVKQCKACDSNCLNCILNSTTCTSCSSTQNKVLSSSKCVCKNGYSTDLNNNCYQCSKTCLTCSTTPAKCTSCNIDRTLVLEECKCLSHSYEDGAGKCQPCNYTCQTCSSATQCLSCDTNSKRTLSSSKCLCNDGFYDIGANNCFPCDSSCLTCKTENTTCTSCDLSQLRDLIGSVCQCLKGYFEDSDKICQKCDPSCVTCIQSQQKCTSCEISKTFRVDLSYNQNKCPCLQGFYDDGTNICKKCSYRCLNCLGNSNNCTHCYINPGFFRDNISPVCNCNDGYFDDGIQIICQKCGPKCLTCENDPENCLICESVVSRLSAPKCDCKQGYFEDEQKKCQKCSINCLDCQKSPKNCISCKPDRIGKQCQCQEGYYEANLPLCQSCSYKCATCIEDPLNCITCASDRINPPNCLCKEHYYDNYIDPECQECDQYCGKCDFNGCIDCAANRIQNLKTCICPIDSISYTFTPYCSNCDVAVVQGIFSDDLDQLVYTFEFDLQFNFPTQVDKQAYCQYLIAEESLKLIGESPLCKIDKKQLIVSLGSGAAIMIGDEIQFNTEILMHTQCTTPLNLILNQQLQPPSQELKPKITVNYLQVPVSPCQPIEIQISQQYVNGQRNLQLKWQSSFNIHAIDIANQLQFQTLTIEQGQLQENSDIEIIIAYTNFLGQNDSTVVQFQTLSASVPQLQFKMIKKSFISWAPIKVMAYFSNTVCTQGQSKSLNNAVQIQFEEVEELRYPSNSNPIQFQQSLFNIEQSEGLISSIIPARILSLNTNYSIMSRLQDIETNKEVTAQYTFQIERSPLMVQIVGGSKIQNYLKAFTVEIQAKDPDLQSEWNQDPDIILSVECLDLQNSNRPCADQNNQTIHINKTSNIQQIGARLFKPFTVLLFKVSCQKQELKASTQASIILLDEELPSINVSYPVGYKIRDVNVNEKLSFEIMIDKNQILSDLDFSVAIIYNYETVFVKSIPNQMVEITIWEGFQKFNFINQISLRFQAHDIKYLMPQTSSVTLNVNMPPVNSIITIFPQLGDALFTYFTIRITNSKDKDSPLQYRYAYYESHQLYEQDILSGRQENLIILQDFTSVQTFKTRLQSGNLTILLTVSDSLGSWVNLTQQIQSKSFYDQWQLDNEQENTTNKCKQLVSELSIDTADTQLLIISALELLKLNQNKILMDCKKAIISQLSKISPLLFDQLLKSANSILKSRISNTLSKIFELNLNTSSRQLESDQSSQICYNPLNNQIQVSYLKQVQQNNSDSDEVIKQISQLKTQIYRAIEQNNNLTQDSLLTFDIGDDQTQRSLQQNVELRISYLRILGSLFINVHDQQIIISNLIDSLMESFRSNLILDTDGIILSTRGFGLQVSKIGQKRFQSYIINKQVDFEDLDLSNFRINRYIQLVKYKSNKYYYTEQFQKQFKNGSLQLNRTETNNSIYEKAIVPYFESAMLDPQLYVDNINQVTKMVKVYQGKLAFNMGVKLDKCNSDSSKIDLTNTHQFVCSQLIDQEWVHNGCQIENFIDQNGQIQYQCYCDKLYPLTLMIIYETNKTEKQIAPLVPSINLEEQINIILYQNITIIVIIMISILLVSIWAIIKIRDQEIYLDKIQQRLDSQKQEEPLGLTQLPRMSTLIFRTNIYYLHELTRLVQINYVHLSFMARLILTSININLLLTLIHIFNVIIKNHFISFGMSVFISGFFQLGVKVLEGFFNGPQALRMFGYCFAMLINVGIISLNFIVNNSEQEQVIQITQIEQVVLIAQTVISLILVYGPLEIVIQYVKLKLAFEYCEELRLDPFNPVINLIYYFLQDEIVIQIVQGARIW